MPQRLQTTATPAQEAIVVYLRMTLLLPLDDLLAVTCEFQLHGAASLTPAVARFQRGRYRAPPRRRLSPVEKTPTRAFKAYASGFLPMGVTRREQRR